MIVYFDTSALVKRYFVEEGSSAIDASLAIVASPPHNHVSDAVLRTDTLGCLDFVVAEECFTGDELHDALVAIHDGEERVPSAVQRTIDAVMAFKAAAD